MATFARGHWARKTHAHNAALRKKLDLEAGGTNTTNGTVRWVQDPVDLRGLPMVGRGVAGAIRHSQPEQALISKQR